MDAFLRRVMLRREQEMELQVTSTLASELPPAKGEWSKRKHLKEKPVDPFDYEADFKPPSSTEPLCSVCNKTKLRSNNRSGVCTICKRKGSKRSAATDEGVLPSAASAHARVASGAKQVDKRFRTLAVALGEDPDDLITAYQERWLKKITERALGGAADEADKRED